MWFTRISINNPVFATMVMAALVVLGLYSYSRLKIEQFPDITFPVVVIQTNYPGAAPESVENDVTRKIEEGVSTISGIKNLTSRSYEGVSVVIIEFDLAIDATAATQDVRDKVALIKSSLRSTVREPTVLRFDPASQAIYSIALKTDKNSQYDLRTLSGIADEVVKKRLQAVRGVGAVNVVGSAVRQIQIQLNPAQMESLGVSINQVTQAIQKNNSDFPAGTLTSDTRSRAIQIRSAILKVDDFNHLVVARRNGIAIHLNEVAQIKDSETEQDSLAMFNDQPTLAFNILKAGDENTIVVVDGLVKEIAALNKDFVQRFPGVSLETVRDGGRAIRLSVNNVRQTIFEGAILAVLIVFLFLNSWRSTVITALTLPISLIGTFFFMYLFGFSINMITLMALSLCVGLLIDDAIVVRENIVRHMTMGKNHRDAAMQGTREIGLAVLATTLSIVAVFLPVGFMGGIIGRFFHSFGITVVVAVLISMLVSFTLDPMLSSIWRDYNHPRGFFVRFVMPVLIRFDRFTERLAHWYHRVLARALGHRRWTLLLALVIFVLSLGLAKIVGGEFVPAADNAESQIDFYTPQGSSLAFTQSKVLQVQNIIKTFPEVRHSFSSINTGAARGKNYASVYLSLTSRKLRTRSVKDINAALRARLDSVAGITVTNIAAPGGPGGGVKTIQVSIQGPNLQQLAHYSSEAISRLKKIPNLVDLDSSFKAAQPLLLITLDRARAADLGVDAAMLAGALEPLFSGLSVSSWSSPEGQDYDVSIRLPAAARTRIEDIERLMVNNGQVDATGRPVQIPLRQIAAITNDFGANQINRRSQNREVELTANVNGRAAGEVAADVRKELDGMQWRQGYRYDMGGATRDMAESLGYAVAALALAVIFIYMVLASQFGSFMQPLAIMSSLPLTLIGVFSALLLFGSTLNIFSMIGIVMLMGLVTKNAILLVDYANVCRATGMARTEALLEAARVRLRPILMTTLAMILGMVPLAFSISEGAETRAPLGQAVIGGVITASILTLVVVPVVYSVLDDLVLWSKRGSKQSAPEIRR